MLHIAPMGGKNDILAAYRQAFAAGRLGAMAEMEKSGLSIGHLRDEDMKEAAESGALAAMISESPVRLRADLPVLYRLAGPEARHAMSRAFARAAHPGAGPLNAAFLSHFYDNEEAILERLDLRIAAQERRRGAAQAVESIVRDWKTRLDALAAAGSSPAPRTPEAGERREDGAVCAGVSPETGNPFYAAAGDEPLTMAWEDAQRTARTSAAHGLDGWRLPALRELDVLRANRDKGALKNTFGTAAGTGLYWSSEAYNPFLACALDAGSGGQHWERKALRCAVRLVRD